MLTQKTSSQPVLETNFPDVNLMKRGKVRDVYDLGDHLLIVATDRISAFDVIMPDPVPDKGKILTQISIFWFHIMESLVPNHLIATRVEDYPSVCWPYADVLQGRSMLVKKAEPFPVECVVRGYISGSGWKSYLESGNVCGIPLKEGLKESEKLPEPLFTPSTKADLGLHDANIDFEETVKIIGRPMAETVKKLSMAIYQKGAALAREKGIIIADTKFEFGRVGEEVCLIDEVLTPDSSRFWPKATYQPGGSQKSFDKQYVRDYLLTLDWDKKPPGPPLPNDVIKNTRKRYLEALEQLTGNPLAD